MAGYYLCVLQHEYITRTWFTGRRQVNRDELDEFSVELNHEDSLRAIFLDAVRHRGGPRADVAQYRMDVYELVDGQRGHLVIPSYTCSRELDANDSPDY